MKSTLTLAALTLALLGGAGAASAQSADFNLWTAAGDVLGGSTSATLTTAAELSGETPLSGSSALEFYELEPALALLGGTLPGDTFEGSGLQHSFVAEAGTLLSFSWTLSTIDYDAGFADRAFVVLDGSTVLPLGTVAASPVSGSFSHFFAEAGSYSLAIVVMDVNDYIGLSTLEVSDLAVSVVPEPGSLALMLAGVAGVGAVVRRRTLAAAQRG